MNDTNPILLLGGVIIITEWYRLSTKEWVVEVCCEVPGLITSTMRYSDRLQSRARRNFRKQFVTDILDVFHLAITDTKRV